MHWTALLAPAARANGLVAPHTDPVSFQPEEERRHSRSALPGRLARLPAGAYAPAGRLAPFCAAHRAAEIGILPTHGDAARSVTLATGHTRDGRLEPDLGALARPGQTLAIYMGRSTLPTLQSGLIGAGLDPSTPAAVVENGGTGQAQVHLGTLASLSAQGWAAARRPRCC